MKRWLSQRIPPANRHRLTMRSIFILPSRFGWMFLLLCVGLFILGTNYQNNIMLLLCYLLVAIFLINLHASYWNFARLDISIDPIASGYAGEQSPLQLRIHPTNAKQAAVGKLQIANFNQPQSLSIDLIPQQPGNPTQVCQLSVDLPKRGVFQFPRITLSSFYPLGLYRCWTHLDFDREIVVYPTPLPCTLQLHQTGVDNEDASGLTTVVGHDDFAGLTPYVVGDSLNRIAWKQVAKQQNWVSKSFDSHHAVTGWLVLPTVSTEQLETALSKLAFQINQCTREGIQFGLLLGRQRIAPASGDQHRHACLRALAEFRLH
ncbi:DUF58 domain-containing protein [Alteromonas oceanisediminis]|uniref:DUF58 domain-containing protein n=1 Tax=Alteromonas oceanisediminis TaxID=2836180 RepID=UPI001BD99F03|nr:DUF58 domain-containing protein [Alteromonas oceanisediminis]MBT0587311.1 DUF58 domain-containing protein [Alteromonas oceanisediminis]